MFVNSLMMVALWGQTSLASSLPNIEFTKANEVSAWEATRHISRLLPASDGIHIEVDGSDPHIIGPARDYPDDQPLWLRIRIRSDQGGTGQVFYFRQNATEEHSIRFVVAAGGWREVRLPLPTLGAAYRLRLDPPGTGGEVVVAFMRFEPRLILEEPVWVKTVSPRPGVDAPSISSGTLRLIHDSSQWGGFEVFVAGKSMATGHVRSRIGYVHEDEVRWLDVASSASVRITTVQNAIVSEAIVRDDDGGLWRIRRRFSVSGLRGAIDLEVTVSTDRDRSVVFLPMFVVLPGVGSFGQAKGQGLFAGLEYLENEPSSSEADVIGPASRRRVPDSLKITFPLMVIQAMDRYVGLLWRKKEMFSAVFDSPDRTFCGGGHLIGILFPGSDGTNRVEGNLLPYEAEVLRADRAVTLHATIIGGRGNSVVPAIKQYISLRGLPAVPAIGMSFQQYVHLAAGGWLDSKIREGNLWRHAWWPGVEHFVPTPAPDAAVFLDWLSHESLDPVSTRRLRSEAAAAIGSVDPEAYDFAGISHVRSPVVALRYGHVAESVVRAGELGRDLRDRFGPDGSVAYQKSDDGADFGKTHDAPTANGHTGQVVVRLLRSAIYSGDSGLIDHGLCALRDLDRYLNTVPRGAQTWEVPLHTPDILASSHLVDAYLLGYELTGEQDLLKKAIYWAWTGVPFVYLVNPTAHPVGLYATVPVLGATYWRAPVWFGLPVQWCGLVYAAALYRLDGYDQSGPWRRLADGITACGIQMSFPPSNSDLVGLLPDAFQLRTQQRLAVAINPGTVQANAVQLFRRPAIYDYRVLRTNGLIVHSPGSLLHVQERMGHVSFTIRQWAEHPCFVLLVGFKSRPAVRINGKSILLEYPHVYLDKQGGLILQIENSPRIDVAIE